MWSPESRKQNAADLQKTAEKLMRYRQLADRFRGYFMGDDDNARQLGKLRVKLEDLEGRARDRQKRLAKGVVKIGVVGLEKQGKSAFLSAWLKSEKLLPSEAERCTWSTTVIEPGNPGDFRGLVEFYSDDEFKKRIESYFNVLEAGSAERWMGLSDSEIRRLQNSYRDRMGFEVDDPDRAGQRDRDALNELKEINRDMRDIRAKLNKPPLQIQASSIDDLADRIRPFIALKDTMNGNRPYPGVRAVKVVTVTIPVHGAMPGVVLMDLPGIDAPSDKARRDTESALADEVDVTIFVKDVTRPSLVRHEIDLLRTAQTADRSISLKDRMFVVLTKADMIDHPDENGNWNWSLAVRSFKDQGIDRVYPYSKVWVHQGTNMEHPVARQLMDYYGVTHPVHGLERLQSAISTYLSTDVEALDRKVSDGIQSEFKELESQLRGALSSVKDALSDREFDRRAAQVFDEHFEHFRAGEDPVGLMPEIRSRLSKFMDYELSPSQADHRAKRARHRIKEIREDLLAQLTPEEAEAKRRQVGAPGLKNETQVETLMRAKMRERVNRKIASLGEDFRSTARESIEHMLNEMFIKASYEGGRLELLLPPGKSLIDRIDILGRSGHVSERAVQSQKEEMEKADVAFEVLSRYFARQIIGILDASDSGDREIREKELQGLEQFFGVGIADRAAPRAMGVVGQVRAKFGGSGDDSQAQPVGGSGFPSGGGGPFFPAAPAPARRKDEGFDNRDGSKGESKPVEYPEQKRDWSQMLARLRNDVDRICNFLDALANNQRGLQKYHEEVVTTVKDAWIEPAGVQSLSRWVRSECAQVWPHKFAVIETEKDRARSDIRALEELFGVGESA
ncbi:MAG: dynamin family protein [Polyangiaceae bacterium]|nr:dynamin family protein [Polyangiaceae bacterium]